MKYYKLLLLLGVLSLSYIPLNGQEPLPGHGNRMPVLVDDINGNLLLELKVDKDNKIWGVPLSAISAKQDIQLRTLETEMQKKINLLNNQIEELKARQRTLEALDKPDMEIINKLIDDRAALLANKMKIKAAYKQRIRSILTHEQRVEFDARVP